MLIALAAVLLCLPLAPGESVLRGLDPVELCVGRETPGIDAVATEHGGFRYVFASDENRQRFATDPERWGIQLGGGCGRMGPLSGSCSDQLFAVHEGRIYIFASDACRASFVKSPAKFVDHDDPPLFEGTRDSAEAARGRALLARVLDAFGGAGRVDAVRALRLETRGVETSGGQEHKLRDTRTWRLPDDLRDESAWDEWVYAYVVTAEGAVSGGKHLEPLSPAATRELRRQMGREPLWLLRHRDAAGFTLAPGDGNLVDSTPVETLRVHFEGATTTWFIDPATGRILRAAWRGRLGTSANGEIVVDYSDFRQAGSLQLPHAQEVSLDGTRDATLSGTYAAVEVDPEIPATDFSLSR